jgi:medium-chain acyl-[acyl-carrier-protein] hydrolase
MKFQLTQSVRYDDLDAELNLRLAALVRFCQESAVRHSEQAGYSAERLIADGVSWMMHKLGVDIRRYPRSGETLAVTTWSRGGQGFRAYRDFVVSCTDAPAEVVAAAVSEWFFVDAVRGRPKRFPPVLMEEYTVETDRALEVDFEDWPEWAGDGPEFELALTTRRSDFDSNGHANHAAYLDFLETLLWRAPNDFPAGSFPPVRSVRLTFAGATPPAAAALEGKLRRTPGGALFLFAHDGGPACHGSVTF